MSRGSATLNRLAPGFSIIELMIGMTIGLLITGALGFIYVNNRQTFNVQDRSARVQESGRFALENIGRSLRQAGNINMAATGNKRYCNCVPIDGTNGVANAPDTTTVQYEAGEDELVGGVWGARDCTGGFAAAGTLLTNTFSLTGTNFQCNGSVGGTQTLVSDVADFQVVYGVDTTPPTTNTATDEFCGKLNANALDSTLNVSVNRVVDDPSPAVGTSYLPTPRGQTQGPCPINQIVTARVCVLVQSELNVVAAGGRYLNCAGALTNSPDTRLRRAFIATYTLRNAVVDLP